MGSHILQEGCTIVYRITKIKRCGLTAASLYLSVLWWGLLRFCDDNHSAVAVAIRVVVGRGIVARTALRHIGDRKGDAVRGVADSGLCD